MAEILPFQPIAPFFGILFIEKNILDNALAMCENIISPLDIKCEPIPFSYSDYYEKEMGKGIMRMWIGSSEPADPSGLADWKFATDKIERELAVNGKRAINLDPGFVGLSKVVLASLKDHPQRLPIERGCYGEIELIFQNMQWQNVPWTYRPREKISNGIEGSAP
jgi:hypothetical protein